MTPDGVRPWEEWRERCAIVKCGAEGADAMRALVHHRFRLNVAAVLGWRNVESATPDAGACFGLLEEWCAASRQRGGRRYKEWLFARAEGQSGAALLATIESGVSLLVRNVARKWLAGQKRDDAVSLDAPIPGTNGLSLSDLVPDETAPSASDALMGEDAETVARAVFKKMKPSVRLVMLSRVARLPLYHPRLLAEFGFGKSRANEVWKGVIGEIASAVAEEWPGEPPSWKVSMAMRASDALDSMLVAYDAGAVIRTRLAKLARA